MVLIAASLFVGACSSDGGSDATKASVAGASSTDAERTSTTPKATTTTSAPSTSTSAPAPTTTVATPATLQPVAQRLIDAYDNAVSAILGDPRVASDPNNASVKAYLALFPEGSSFAAGTVQFWASEGAAGRFYRPGPTGKLQSSVVQSVEVRSTTEAAATVCATTSMQVVDAAGQPQSAQGGTTGVEVVMVLVGDRWLLRDLTQLASIACPKPGSGT